ncbi:riboflavin synthase [Terriglobus roseus]|uniref:Riboflavin synthase n=1 Tax=Terriglobus roseus TaxID=392734 RepID=A0A1H4RWG2_9BACT|nr:riboflavin synthase [Terriglobus roseus]SEC36148.1 riboflavin synthase alpha chain [Terriglobus roseus]
MFTGLIAETGTIISFEKKSGAARLRVTAPTLATQLHTGDSIAVSGVCLTALAITPTGFEADLLDETLRRTSLEALAPGSSVNLELPTPAGTPLGGHVVQGHVDGVGRLVSLTAVTMGTESETDWLLKLTAPATITRYIVEKGSLSVNGISLTVAAVERVEHGDALVTIAIIPHTYAVTNLHTLQPGDPINLEVDVLAKYAEQRSHTPKTETITELSLIELGF